MKIKTFGLVDERSLRQLERCMAAGDAELGVLCADHHPGYSQPIGGGIAYEGYVSPSGVGYDIGCGNKAARTDLTRADLDALGGVERIMGEIVSLISFGMGVAAQERVDHPVLEKIRTADFEPQRKLAQLAESQLGSVGSGNLALRAGGSNHSRPLARACSRAMTLNEYHCRVAGVASLASDRGVISALALDHRQAFVNALAKVGVLEPTQAEIVATKSRVIAALAGDASAILLDQLTATAVDDPAPPLVLPLEAQGATMLDGGRVNRLEFSAAQNAEAGAAACKLLVHYRSDHASTAARQRELVQDAIEQCRAVDLPLVLEPIVYRLAADEDPGFELRFGELVVAAARDLAALRPSLMKMEYPGEGLCSELTAACAPVPWVLLGGGDADGETFARRLESACSAGASGFMVGRVVWGVALGLDPTAQEKTLGEVAQPLFRRLAAIADEAARPVASA